MSDTSSLDLAPLKAVVFDWDNTLAQSRETLVLSINEVLPQYNLPLWDEVCVRRDNNLSFRDNFKNIFGNLAVEAYEKYRKIYLKNVAAHIKTFPKVPETLRFFRAHHIPMMIMTNKDRRLLEFELPLLFDPALFRNIVCGHEAKHDKPYREHLLLTLKNVVEPTEISPESVWVIGDSPADSRCAVNAGARAIRIGSSLWKEDLDTDTTGITFFDSFETFYKALKTLSD